MSGTQFYTGLDMIWRSTDWKCLIFYHECCQETIWGIPSETIHAVFLLDFEPWPHTLPIIVGGKTIFKSKLVGIIHANIWLCSEYEERMEHVFMNQRYWLIILLSEALFTLCWVYGFEFYVCSSFGIVYLIPYTSCLKLGSKR